MNGIWKIVKCKAHKLAKMVVAYPWRERCVDYVHSQEGNYKEDEKKF